MLMKLGSCYSIDDGGAAEVLMMAGVDAAAVPMMYVGAAGCCSIDDGGGRAAGCCGIDHGIRVAEVLMMSGRLLQNR